jgi:hypothetical protein
MSSDLPVVTDESTSTERKSEDGGTAGGRDDRQRIQRKYGAVSAG